MQLFKFLYQFGWELLCPTDTRGTDKRLSRECTCTGLLRSPRSLAADCQQGLNDTMVISKLKSSGSGASTDGARAAWQLTRTGTGGGGAGHLKLEANA